MWKKIKLILKSVKEYKKSALITPLFMIGEAAIECLLPYVMSEFVEKIEVATTFTELLPLIFALIGMTCASIACGILGGWFASIASNGFAKNLRHDMYTRLCMFSFENIDKFSSSSLVTRMTTDVQNVQQSFQMCTRILFRAPLMFFFSIIMAFITGGSMAWIFVVAAIITALGLILIIMSAMKIFRRVFKRYDKLNESVQENISAIRVVKSYVREDYEKEKFNTASTSVAKDFIKGETIVAFNNPWMNTCVHLVNLGVIYFCSKIISETATTHIDLETGKKIIDFGALSIPKMSALLTYGISIMMNLMMLSMIMVMLVISLESVRRIGEVLEEQPTIINPVPGIMELEDGSVIFDNVDFKYNKKAERNSLDNICLNIKSGQFIGVLGATGSGKTSLINLISRLYDVTDGELIVGGHRVQEYDIHALRDQVSVVLQKNFLFGGTIKSNLLWGNENATDEQIMKACEIAQAKEFIDQLPDGLDTRIEQGGNNVSGGQKQRLCIARALLKSPKILILDDSTSAVDTRTDSLIRKGLREDIPQTTKIVIAQRISSIEDADQIIIMDDGHIDAVGTHEELLKNNAIYQEVYYTQTKKGGNN